jgi:hypothetical protein
MRCATRQPNFIDMKNRRPPVRDPRRAAPPRAAPVATDDTAAETQAPARVAEADVSRRQAMIAEAAYFRAEQRNFESGYELDDWCAAESDVDSSLARPTPTPCGP